STEEVTEPLSEADTEPISELTTEPSSEPLTESDTLLNTEPDSVPAMITYLQISETTSPFTVTIPSTAQINEDLVIACTLNESCSVSVTVQSANGFLLKNENGTTLAYSLKKADKAETLTDSVAAIFSGIGDYTQTLTLTLSDPNTNPEAGTYQDTLTFTVTAE
ncbi:MAG: hypothetical protein Q4F41_17640, partial [Eubacteriales bacterium]|nr:hypothetical protein [Eubacteriales bacterium]